MFCIADQNCQEYKGLAALIDVCLYIEDLFRLLPLIDLKWTVTYMKQHGSSTNQGLPTFKADFSELLIKHAESWTMKWPTTSEEDDERWWRKATYLTILSNSAHVYFIKETNYRWISWVILTAGYG